MLRFFLAAVLSTSFALTSRVHGQEESASDRPLVRDPWHGFPVGSWIVESETLKRDGEVQQTRREKTVRVEDAGLGEIVISVHPEQNGKFPDDGAKRLHVQGAIPADMENSELGEERRDTLEIDGRTFECDIKTWRVRDDRNGIRATYTLWYSDAADIPYRELSSQGPDLAMPPDVLRADVEVSTPRYKETASLQVKSLRDTRKVGAASLICVREEGTFKTEGQGRAGELSMSRWLAGEVPSHEILSISRGTLGTSKLERRREVLEFHVAEQAGPVGERSN